MDDDHGYYDDFLGGRYGPFPPHPHGPGPADALALALLEDLAAVLDRHGLSPLRGYVLAEITACLHRVLN